MIGRAAQRAVTQQTQPQVIVTGKLSLVRALEHETLAFMMLLSVEITMDEQLTLNTCAIPVMVLSSAGV